MPAWFQPDYLTQLVLDTHAGSSVNGILPESADTNLSPAMKAGMGWWMVSSIASAHYIRLGASNATSADPAIPIGTVPQPMFIKPGTKINALAVSGATTGAQVSFVACTPS